MRTSGHSTGFRLLAMLLSATIVLACQAGEQQPPVTTITIKDHVFTPQEVTVPANKKVKLLIKNEDATPEEFESHSLNREKVIQGNSSATIFIGPLKPGSYSFIGEFNAATAKGVIIAE